MSEHGKSSTGLWVMAGVLAVIALPVVYALMLGPMILVLPDEMCEVLFRPMELCAELTDERPEWFWNALSAYFEWWDDWYLTYSA